MQPTDPTVTLLWHALAALNQAPGFRYGENFRSYDLAAAIEQQLRTTLGIKGNVYPHSGEALSIKPGDIK